MKRLLRYSLYLKMLIGFIISFLLAELFKLEYSYTAGVITVLSLWYTKETVIKTATIRFISSLLGLVLSAFLFWLIGYQVWNLILVVTVILLTLFLLKLEYGATIALVLVGQQWTRQTINDALNAFYILVIGTVPALLLNLFVLKGHRLLSEAKTNVDLEVINIIKNIVNNKDYDFDVIEKLLEEVKDTLRLSQENYEDKVLGQAVAYLTMREQQTILLKEISDVLISQDDSEYKAKIISHLAKYTSNIGEIDYASALKKELTTLLNYYQTIALPKTRDEFEHRARLYHVITQLDKFLTLKIEYHRTN